ncbi:MAG: phage tail tape measure C-terminal domain-containing protein [Sterolibacterium sp.]
MAIAGQLEILMRADIARISKDMADAKSIVGSTMGSIEKSVAQAKSALGLLGFGLGVGYFASLIKGAVDLADSLNKLSQRTGVSVENLSQMQYAAKLADVSNETLTTSYKKLNISIAEGLAGDAKKIALFKSLGISTADLGNGTQEVMMKIADAYAKASSSASSTSAKVAIGNGLMGKSADEMIPLLNAGRQGIAELMNEADKLGLTISADFAAKAEEFNDNLARIKTSSQKLSIALAGELVESLGKAMKAMADASVAGGRLQGVINFIQTLFTGTDQHKNNVALVEDTEKLMRAEKALADARASGMNPIGIAAREKLVNDLKANIQTTLTYRKILTEEEDKSLAAAAKLEAIRKNGKELKLPGTDAKLIAAELKLYESAVKSLSDKLGNLERQTESEKLAFEEYGKNVTLADGTIVHLTGSLEKLTPAHKAMLVIIAAEVDARKQAIEVSKNWVDAINAEIAVQEKLDALQSDYNLTNSQTAKELQFQIDLIGKTTAEQQQLTAARQIDLDLQNKLLEAAKIPGITPDALAEMESLLTAAAGRQKTIIAGLIAYKLGKERAWAIGAKEAYDEYVDNATNAAKQAKELYSAMYKGMEDDAFNFFRHGELSASNFVDSIKDQLARLAAQKFTVWLVGEVGMSGVGGAAVGGAAGGGLINSALGSMIGSGATMGALGTAFGEGFMATLGGSSLSGGAAAGILATGGAAGAGTMGMIGAAAPYVGLALALYSVFSDNGTPKLEGGFSPNGMSIGGRDALGNLQGSQRGDVEAAQKISAGIVTAYQTVAQQLGIKNGKIDIGVFYSQDPTGESSTQLQIIGGAYNRSNAMGGIENAGKTSQDLQDAIAQSAAQLILTNLQASDLPAYMKQVFGALDSTATSQQINDAVSFAAGLKQIRDALTETRTPLQIMADDMTALGTSAATFKADFVEAIDAGISPENVAAWQHLGQEIEQLTPAVEQAAVAARSAADILNERNRLQDQYDQLTMTTVELLAKQRNVLDASNQGLFDQVQAAQAAKDANDALAQSQTDAADAAAQLVSINQGWQDQLDLMTGAQTENSLALRDAGDESTRSIMRQVFAMRDASSSMETFTSNVLSLVSGIHNSVSSSIFGLNYGLADSAGKYGMLDAQAKQFDDLMKSSTDINLIAKYAQSEIDTINKAFALLDPTQQAATLDQNTLLLTKIDSFVSGSGADAVSRKNADNAALSAAVAKAVKEALADLATAQTNAALAQASAASKIENVIREPVILNITKAPGIEVSVS